MSKTGSITANKINMPYEVTAGYKYVFSDGTTFTLTQDTAPTKAQILAGYIKAAMTNVPPVVDPPPVIIPPAGAVRNVTMKDIEKLNGASNENLKVTDKTYNDQAQPKDCNNVTIDLSGVTFGTKNMPVFELQGHNNGLQFIGGAFIGCDNACFSYRYADLYTGKSGSFLKGLILNGQVLSNSAVLFVNYANKIAKEGYYGVIQGFQVLNGIFKDCPNIGNIVLADCLEDYLVQGNTVNNINTQNANHNGIFSLGGNGVFKGNRVTNHQGDALRSRPMNVMGTGKQVVADSNYVVGSTRYSAFEFQPMPEDLKTGGVKTIDKVVVSNNIAGNLSSDHQRNGVLIDLFPYSSNPANDVTEVTNNVGFGMFALNGDLNQMISLNGGAVMPKLSGNKYYATQDAAVSAGVSI